MLLDRLRQYLACALLVSALLIGGGGGPLPDLVVELLGVALLAVTLLGGGPRWPRGAYVAIVAIALIGAIPLLQLVPLPASIWRALPGRELAIAARDAIGAGRQAFPLSLDPEATWRSALYLVPGAALFLSTLRADEVERRRLILLAVAGIFIGMLAGILQVTLGNAFYLYPTVHQGNATGLLVNRNHEATLLLIGVAFLPMLVPPRVGRPAGEGGYAAAPPRPELLWVVLGLMVLFSLSVVITTSRAGMLAMPLVLAAAITRALPRRARSPLVFCGAVVLLVVVAMLGLLSTNSVTYNTVMRFMIARQDGRPIFWADTMAAIPSFWPFGSGIGTFVPVYATFENLDNVGSNYVNHAHEEYLEVLLEAGIFAVVAILAYVAALVGALRQRLVGPARHWRACALIGIAVVLLHSTVDYPLRILSLVAVFALLHALLFAAPVRSGSR